MESSNQGLPVPPIESASRLIVRSGYDLATRQVEYSYQMRARPGEDKLELLPDDPLVRAFKSSLVEGRPPDEWRIVLLHDKTGMPPLWLGTFVRTLGKRFLYFPATRVRLGRNISEVNSAQLRPIEGELVDHITLEPRIPRGWRRGHLTFLGRGSKRRHGWSFRTRPRNTWHYWFSLLTTRLDDFPRLPALITMNFSSGRPDLVERFPDFASRGGFTGIEWANSAAQSHDNFIQLDVWLSDEGNQPVSDLRPIPFVRARQLVQADPADQTIVFHVVEFGFADSEERLAVGVTSPTGRIRGPMLVRADR